MRPPPLEVVVDEAALRRPVGGVDVHRRQLQHVLRAIELPTVTVRVLPFAAGVHPTMASPFTLLRFGDLGEPDIAHAEHSLGRSSWTRSRTSTGPGCTPTGWAPSAGPRRLGGSRPAGAGRAG